MLQFKFVRGLFVFLLCGKWKVKKMCATIFLALLATNISGAKRTLTPTNGVKSSAHVLFKPRR